MLGKLKSSLDRVRQAGGSVFSDERLLEVRARTGARTRARRTRCSRCPRPSLSRATKSSAFGLAHHVGGRCAPSRPEEGCSAS